MVVGYIATKGESISKREFIPNAALVLAPCDVLDSPFWIVQQFVCPSIPLWVPLKEAQRHICLFNGVCLEVAYKNGWITVVVTHPKSIFVSHIIANLGSEV